MPATEFLAPATLAEAMAAVSDPDALAVGGATSVALLLKNRLAGPSTLVWLGRVEELKGIAVLPDGGLRLGAGVTLAELAASADVRRLQPVLAQAAGGIGNVRVRAVATLGGHVAHADPRQDLPPVLLALGADFLLVESRGQRRLPAAEFFTGYMETALEPGELVTAVETPPPEPGQRSAYIRFCPHSEDDYPTVGVAACWRPQTGGVRIGLGGVAARPLLVTGDADVEAMASAAEAAADPVSDQRGSAAYKRAMTRLFTRRALRQVLPPRPAGR